MLADWFTIAAQAVNFLILVYLLRRFLYGPIATAIEERRQELERRAAEVLDAAADARRQEEEYRQLRDELAADREAIIKQAAEDARKWAAELRAETRAEVEGLERRWRDALARDQEVFWSDLGGRVAQEVGATVQHVLGELAGTDLDSLVETAFLTRLRELQAEERERLVELARGPENGGQDRVEAEMVSARETAPEYRAAVQAEVDSLLGRPVRLGFLVNPELVAGIELRAPGWKTGWSVRGHLDGMRERVDAFIAQQTALRNPAGEQPA